jgi:hypothetical protein
MAKLNEGDVIEGIFTIGIGLYLADGKIDKTKLNKIRTQIDPKMFITGRAKHVIAKDVMRSKPGRPPDFFNINLEMRLKNESTSMAYGGEYAVLYNSSKDVGNIDKKIDQLIAQMQSANFTRRIKGAVDYFLDNNVGEIVTFNVIADGIAGESSGGEVKGDVTLEVYAVKKGSNQKIISGILPFSIKSESVTVANLSPYKGMLAIADAMGIKWDAADKYVRLTKPFKGPVEQAAKFKMIEELYAELKTEIKKASSNKTKFTKDAMDFFATSTFGNDLSDVVDVQSSGVKEITVEYFEKLKQNVSLTVEERGLNLVFVDVNTKSPIFQIRTKLRPPPANEAKFYLEAGKGVYSK